MQQIPQQAKRQAEQAARQASPWLVWLGRLGYAAKGVVYGLVGVLALLAALGQGGETTDTRGVLQTIVAAPFGRVLLAVVALGLFGHAVWRWVQAAWDTENKGTDAGGIAARVAYAAIGVVYVGLALAAARLVLGTGGNNQSSDQSAQDWTARLLQQPSNLGRWLVGLVGLAVIGVGGYQLYRAYTAKFREKLKLHEMSAAEQTWTMRVGRGGFVARGVVFAIIGGFLVVAALREQADQARGLSGALDTVAQQSPWLLGIVALGLVAYGVFMVVQARYRRMVIT